MTTRMRLLALLSPFVLWLAVTGRSEAETSPTATLLTSVPQSCTIMTPSFVAPVLANLTEQNIGAVKFACNFVGTASVNLDVPGGTKLVSGPNKVRYQIAWDLAPSGREYRLSSASATTFTETFDATTGATPNAEVTGDVWVQLLQVPTIAGTYQSIATYTISP